MAEIVNLRRARKAAKRAEDEKDAAAQRVSHGTPKALRQETEARRDKAKRDLEAHRIEPEE
jgi:Domain of unknown function (DUF4169)